MFSLKKYILVGLFVFFSCATLDFPMLKNIQSIQKNKKTVKAQENINVLLFVTRDDIKIESKNKIEIFKQTKIVYRSMKSSLIIPFKRVDDQMIIKSSIIKVNGKRYRTSIILIKRNGYIYVLNKLSIDDYIKGVLPGEVPISWPIETLKAQAVASRTYALYHINKKKTGLYDLDSTKNFQVYKGYDFEKESTSKAVNETSGQYLVHDNKLIISYFHSTCGGHTADDYYVWKGKNLPYLKSVQCSYCSTSPYHTWQAQLSLHDLSKAVSKKTNFKKISRIRFIKYNGRVHSVELSNYNKKEILSGNNFRLLFTSKKLKSLYFKAYQHPNGLLLKGRGWGHGVGMCQWGSKGMALQGKSYNEILSHYYKDTRLSSHSKDTNNTSLIE